MSNYKHVEFNLTQLEFRNFHINGKNNSRCNGPRPIKVSGGAGMG